MKYFERTCGYLCSAHTTDFQIKSKIPILKASFCDYSKTNSFVKEAVEITGKGKNEKAISVGRIDKYITFKTCAPFTNWITDKQYPNW